MTSEWLEYICDSCGMPIADGDGCLELEFAQIRAAQAAIGRWREGHRPDEASTPAPLEAMPKLARWHILHLVCHPQDGDAYEIDVDQVRTQAGLDEWTRHLRSKNWLPLTDWDALVDARSRNGRIVVRQGRGGVV